MMLTLLTEPAAASAWTPDLIKSLFDGLVLLLGAIGTLIGVGVWAIKEIRSSRVQGEKAGAVRDGKLDTLVSQSDTIVAQGNGALAAALARVATLEAINANLSGRLENRVRAAGAEAEVEVHATQIAATKEAVKAAAVAQLPTVLEAPTPVPAAGRKPAEEK